MGGLRSGSGDERDTGLLRVGVEHEWIIRGLRDGNEYERPRITKGYKWTFNGLRIDIAIKWSAFGYHAVNRYFASGWLRGEIYSDCCIASGAWVSTHGDFSKWVANEDWHFSKCSAIVDAGIAGGWCAWGN